MKKITIIGAGLAGTLLALYLARRGNQVKLYEARGDIRLMPDDGGRSINLALSCRGMTSLKAIGIMDEVEKIMVPMRARAIHEENNNVSFQAFGRHPDEYINAVLRTDLNKLLLDKASANALIDLHFDMKLHTINFSQKKLTLMNDKGHRHTTAYELLIGADGAASKVREALQNAGFLNHRREFLPHGYKELSISREHGRNMAREHLHLWPRDSYMLLGNPNRDDSITGSLFLPLEGEISFAGLKDEGVLHAFFKKTFNDAYVAMPNLDFEFFNNPTGNLSTVHCSPWYYEDQCLLIGDAAHGIVPFFGQGMNSAFEDCRILDELLEQFDNNWQDVLPAFFKARKQNTDAVAAMSMMNYSEIQHKIRDEKFNLKKELQQELMHRYPDRYVSMHVLVMFTNTPYHIAKATGEIQEQLLQKITANATSLADMDWQWVDKEMQAYDEKLAGLVA